MKLLYWKMAFFKAGILVIVSTGTCFINGTDQFTTEAWQNLGYFEQYRIIAMAILAGATALYGFLDSTMSELKKGLPPGAVGVGAGEPPARVPTGDTTVIEKKP